MKINKGKGRGTRVIGDLFPGDHVTVEEVCGERARISHPKTGWCNMKNELLNMKYLIPFHRKVSNEMDKVLNQSRQEYCDKNITAIETRMKTITNEPDVDVKSTIQELQRYKTFFQELRNPLLEWKCSRCTFLNPQRAKTCSMCSTARQGELSTEMAEKLERLLTKKPRTVEEKEQVLWEERPKSPVGKLQEQVDDLSKRYEKVAQHVDDLEEANWQLTDRLGKVETTLTSCVLDTTNPKEWDVSLVSCWLDKLGANEYQSDFAEAMIDGVRLLSCDAQRLEELDVRRKHRPMILEGIALLHKQWNEVSNELDEPVLQVGEPMLLEEKEVDASPCPATFSPLRREAQPLTSQRSSHIFYVKPRGTVADKLEEDTGEIRLTQRNSGDGWELVGDV